MVGTVSKVTVNLIDRPMGLFDLPYSFESFVVKKNPKNSGDVYGDQLVYIDKQLDVVYMTDELVEHLVVGGEYPKGIDDRLGMFKIPNVFIAVSDHHVVVLDNGYTDRVVRAGRLAMGVDDQIIKRVTELNKEPESIATIKDVKKGYYENSLFYGLTRIEKEKKKYVLNVLEELKSEVNVGKLKYYYVELFGGFKDVKNVKKAGNVVKRMVDRVEKDRGELVDHLYLFFKGEGYGKLVDVEKIEKMEHRRVADVVEL